MFIFNLEIWTLTCYRLSLWCFPIHVSVPTFLQSVPLPDLVLKQPTSQSQSHPSTVCLRRRQRAQPPGGAAARGRRSCSVTLMSRVALLNTCLLSRLRWVMDLTHRDLCCGVGGALDLNIEASSQHSRQVINTSQLRIIIILKISNSTLCLLKQTQIWKHIKKTKTDPQRKGKGGTCLCEKLLIFVRMPSCVVWAKWSDHFSPKHVGGVTKLQLGFLLQAVSSYWIHQPSSEKTPRPYTSQLMEYFSSIFYN